MVVYNPVAAGDIHRIRSLIDEQETATAPV
jgi:hypothetical protein